MRLHRRWPLFVLTAVLTGCGPMVIWTGHTPDRKVRVQIQEEDGGQVLFVGDSAGPVFDGIAPAGVVFSPDGRRLAYPGRMGEKWTVVTDGMVGQWWDGIGDITFSQVGNSLVYPVLDGSDWMVFKEGELGPRFDVLLAGTFRFDPHSGNLAYGGERGDSAYLVLEAHVGPPFDQVSAPKFLPGGRAVAYAARRGQTEHIVVGEELGRGWEAVAGLTLHPVTGAPAFFGREAGKWFAIVEGARFGPYEAADGMVFSADGGAWAYMARSGGLDRVVVKGKDGPAHPAILPGSLRISPTGDAVAYVAREQDADVAVVDFRRGCRFASIRGLEFSPTGAHYAYVGVDSLGERVVADGKTDAVFDGVSDLVYADDGETLSFLARGPEGGIAVIGQDRHRFPVVAEGSLVVGAEAKHWAVIAGVSRSEGLHFFVDGVDTGRKFDWQELIDVQRPGPGGLPDLLQADEAVRAWVRAEMELFLGERSPKPL